MTDEPEMKPCPFCDDCGESLKGVRYNHARALKTPEGRII